MMVGYIKVYRSLMDKGYYSDSEYVHLWVHLLMKASYQEKEYLFNGKIEHLLPGQFITGRKVLVDETGINRSKIERILKVFERDGQIEQQGNNKFRIISIRNWCDYQVSEQQVSNRIISTTYENGTNNNSDLGNKLQNSTILNPRNKIENSEQQNEQQNLIANYEDIKRTVNSIIENEHQSEQPVSSQRAASEQPVSTINKEKNIKKEKKTSFVLPEWIKKETWDAYREMRTKKRAPLTDRASSLIVKELEKLKSLGNLPEDVLNQSIMKSWTGVFPVNRGGNGNGQHDTSRQYGQRQTLSDKQRSEDEHLDSIARKWAAQEAARNNPRGDAKPDDVQDI